MKAYYHCNYPDPLRRNCLKKHRQSNIDYYQRNNSSDQPKRKVGSRGHNFTSNNQRKPKHNKMRKTTFHMFQL